MATERSSQVAAVLPRGGSAWRTLSYMFHLLWINMMFFSSTLYKNYEPTLLSTVAEEVFRTSILALAISLSLCALLHRQFMALAEHRALDYCGPFLAAAGVAVMAPFLSRGDALPPGVLYGSAVLTGLGSALTLINVGRRFVGVGTTDCIVTVLWATMGSSLLTCSTGLLPFEGCFAAVVVAPFAAIASLHRISEQEAARDRTVQPLGERVSRRLLLKFVACAFMLGIVTGALGGLSPNSVNSRFNGSFLLTFCLASFAASAVILAVLFRRGRGTIESLYRPATVLITVGFALVPLFSPNTSVPYAFVSAGYSLFEMLVWVILCEVASRFQFLITVGFALVPLFSPNTSVPYAFVSAGYSLFEMLVWVILCEVASRFQFTSVQVFGFGRALVVVSIAVIMVIDPFMDLRHNPWLLTVVSSLSIIAVSLLRSYILTTADLVALSHRLWDDGEADEAEGTKVAGAVRTGEDAAQGALLRSYILTTADLVALSHRLWDDGEADEAEGTKVAGAVRTGEDAAQGAAPQAKIPFLKRCALIGEYYGLTKREVDVFRLLAAGRNSARIQEELMISAGTVNTHSHHVFQKMGVHCQQEVIDLFEKADLDAIAKDLKARGA